MAVAFLWEFDWDGYIRNVLANLKEAAAEINHVRTAGEEQRNTSKI